MQIWAHCRPYSSPHPTRILSPKNIKPWHPLGFLLCNHIYSQAASFTKPCWLCRELRETTNLLYLYTTPKQKWFVHLLFRCCRLLLVFFFNKIYFKDTKLANEYCGFCSLSKWVLRGSIRLGFGYFKWLLLGVEDMLESRFWVFKHVDYVNRFFDLFAKPPRFSDRSCWWIYFVFRGSRGTTSFPLSCRLFWVFFFNFFFKFLTTVSLFFNYEI